MLDSLSIDNFNMRNMKRRIFVLGEIKEQLVMALRYDFFEEKAEIHPNRSSKGWDKIRTETTSHCLLHAWANATEETTSHYLLLARANGTVAVNFWCVWNCLTPLRGFAKKKKHEKHEAHSMPWSCQDGMPSSQAPHSDSIIETLILGTICICCLSYCHAHIWFTKTIKFFYQNYMTSKGINIPLISSSAIHLLH